jgi:hypothetical protein
MAGRLKVVVHETSSGLPLKLGVKAAREKLTVILHESLTWNPRH